MAERPTRERLRALAATRPESGRVLSAFVDLDPAQFATADARATQLNALADEAERRADAADDLDHAALIGLREDAETLRGLEPEGLGAGGARGLAIFLCSPAGLDERIAVPFAVTSGVTIGDRPRIAPIGRAAGAERLAVALVSAGDSRLFTGDADGLEESRHLRDFVVTRVREEDRRQHLDHVADALRDLLERDPYDALLISGPTDDPAAFADRLHAYVRERLVGRLDGVDLGSATPATVLEAARGVLDERRLRREDEALDRLRAGLGTRDGRAVAGTDDVHAMLEQRRVEILLLGRDHVDDDAVEAALEQDAEVLALGDRPELGPHGGIAAVLRF